MTQFLPQQHSDRYSSIDDKQNKSGSLPPSASGQSRETFFKLTHNVKDRLIATNLTAAEWRIWAYLACLDPFGDRGVRFSFAELATVCRVKRSTYFAAKAKFQKLGLFNFVEELPKVVNLQGRKHRSDHSLQEEPIDFENSEYSELALTNSDRPPQEKHVDFEKPECSELACTSSDRHPQDEPIASIAPEYSQQAPIIETESSDFKLEIFEIQPESCEIQPQISGLQSESCRPQSEVIRDRSKILDFKPPKPIPKAAPSTPQTIQTYSDFKHTLSDSERENFEKFVREEWKKITSRNGESGQEIVSLERFLRKPEDRNDWYERFSKSSAGRAAKSQALATLHDWRSDARFEEWIWFAFNRGYEWVHENEAEKKIRNEFYDWAFAVNAFEGICLQ